MKKETTIYDIARELNISPATVSRAMNGHPAINIKTKERVGVSLFLSLGDLVFSFVIPATIPSERGITTLLSFLRRQESIQLSFCLFS